MHDAKTVRKAMWWITPLFLGIATSGILATQYGLIPTFREIASLAPVVRIAPVSQMAPFMALTFLVALVLGAMRAIPCSDNSIKKFERFFIFALLLNVFVMLLIPVTSVAQRFYMPFIGYSICTDLKDNPAMWFTDWVRNPDWCVKGKSRDWVNEQASKTTQRIAPQPLTH